MKFSKNPLDDLLSLLQSQNETTKGRHFTLPKEPDFGAMKQPFGDISNTSFDEMLKGLNGNLPENISSNTLDSLKGFLDGYGSISSTERTDMLMQYILQLLTSNDQRAWDKSVLQEQRSYDNPLNQLARLMGAGISRDAAIAMISSGGSGSGAGAALIGSGAGVSAPSVSAPSGSTEIARSQMILGGVAEIANTLVNLCSQGMSMLQAYETYQFQKNSAYMSSQQVEDYNAVNTVNQQLQILSESGVLGDKKIEDFRSTNELTSFLRERANQSPDVKKLIESDSYKRATGTIYGRQYFNDLMSSRRSSQDAGHLADLAITQAELSNATQQIQQDKLSEEISTLRSNRELIDAQAQKTMQDIVESKARIQIMDKQGNFIDVQTGNVRQQTRLLEVQTDVANLNYEILESGFPLMKEARVSELRLQALKWRALFNPQAPLDGTANNDPLQSAVYEFLRNPQNAADIAYLQSLRNGSLIGFSREFPALWNLLTVFQEMGILDMVKTGVENTAQAGATAFMLNL